MSSIILTESSQFCLLYVLEPKEVAIFRLQQDGKNTPLLLGTFCLSLTSRNPNITILGIHVHYLVRISHYFTH